MSTSGSHTGSTHKMSHHSSCQLTAEELAEMEQHSVEMRKEELLRNVHGSPADPPVNTSSVRSRPCLHPCAVCSLREKTFAEADALLALLGVDGVDLGVTNPQTATPGTTVSACNDEPPPPEQNTSNVVAPPSNQNTKDVVAPPPNQVIDSVVAPPPNQVIDSVIAPPFNQAADNVVAPPPNQNTNDVVAPPPNQVIDSVVAPPPNQVIDSVIAPPFNQAADNVVAPPSNQIINDTVAPPPNETTSNIGAPPPPKQTTTYKDMFHDLTKPSTPLPPPPMQQDIITDLPVNDVNMVSANRVIQSISTPTQVETPLDTASDCMSPSNATTTTTVESSSDTTASSQQVKSNSALYVTPAAAANGITPAAAANDITPAPSGAVSKHKSTNQQTHPVYDLQQSTSQQTNSTHELKQPTNQQADPSNDRRQPTNDNIGPTNELKQLTNQQADPSNDRRQPTNDNIGLPNELKQPANQQADPSYDRRQPTNDNIGPTNELKQLTNQQADPSYDRRQPTNDNIGLTDEQPANQQLENKMTDAEYQENEKAKCVARILLEAARLATLSDKRKDGGGKDGGGKDGGGKDLHDKEQSDSALNTPSMEAMEDLLAETNVRLGQTTASSRCPVTYESKEDWTESSVGRSPTATRRHDSQASTVLLGSSQSQRSRSRNEELLTSLLLDEELDVLSTLIHKQTASNNDTSRTDTGRHVSHYLDRLTSSNEHVEDPAVPSVSTKHTTSEHRKPAANQHLDKIVDERIRLSTEDVDLTKAMELVPRTFK